MMFIRSLTRVASQRPQVSNSDRGKKKVIGMMKDEAGGKQITEFVGLRSKLYSFKIDEKGEKKCKGVKKSEVKRTINFKDYKDCLPHGR